MKFKPLGNRVVITKPKHEDKKTSGIILPDTAEEKRSQEGIIFALGEGKKIKKLSLKKGDKVIYKEFGPTEIEIDGKEYLIAEDDDILAVII
ncbi:MAG: co-chaperone GroES [Candidatus Berkelbacteria bacterium]|nr:co-chaperone GroES [Candidatus Berkelbacteria bacterium]